MWHPRRVVEGVTKFRAEHHHGGDGLSDRRRHHELIAWRKILFDLGLIGQDPRRYDGAGYGNISVRVGAPSAPRGRRRFLVTGTQTGGLEAMDESALCLVEAYDLRTNEVWSRGPSAPSSESMTHGAIYDLSTRIRWVVHVHSPVVWRRAAELRLPTTATNLDYGTPEMAFEVRRLYRDTHLADFGVLAMGGHADGIISFGHTCAEASSRLLQLYARALMRTS